MTQLGKVLIIASAILLVLGIILYFAGNKLNWLGNLPGDIRIEKENFRFYFPFTTMIILSAIASFIIWLLRKIF